MRCSSFASTGCIILCDVCCSPEHHRNRWIEGDTHNVPSSFGVIECDSTPHTAHVGWTHAAWVYVNKRWTVRFGVSVCVFTLATTEPARRVCRTQRGWASLRNIWAYDHTSRLNIAHQAFSQTKHLLCTSSTPIIVELSGAAAAICISFAKAQRRYIQTSTLSQTNKNVRECKFDSYRLYSLLNYTTH